MEIPVVDFTICGLDEQHLDNEAIEVVGREIYEAFSNVGFVYLKNTGIPNDLIEKVFRISKQFFELSSDIKNKYADDKNFSGYIELFKEGTNIRRPKDIKEAYNVLGMKMKSGEVPWPDAEVSDFSTEYKSFFDACHQFTSRLLEVLSIGMKIKDRNYLQRSHSRIGEEKNYTTLRSLYYPPIPDELKPGQIRLGEHSDYGSLTLLFQDHIGGLEIETNEGEFVEAKPIPGTILVNIGDTLQFWTKGRLKSTKHRIMVPAEDWKRKTYRQSLAYFIHPNFEVELSEMEYESSCTNSNNADDNIEKPITCFEYVENKLNSIYK